MDEHPQYHYFFDHDEVNFWSSFKGDLLNFCRRSDYDLLINYFNNEANSIYSLISTRTKAISEVLGFMLVQTQELMI